MKLTERMSNPTPYDFEECLAASHAAEDLPFWGEAYRKAFPTMRRMENLRSDGQHQRAGIDRVIILDSAKVIYVDEKYRRRSKLTGKVYDDIALEYISNDRRGTPGWVCKPLLADYIAYAIGPLGKCYLLPVPQLQAVWQEYGNTWLATKRKFPTQNSGYKTLNVCVEPAELFPLIGNCLRVTFAPYDPMDDMPASRKPTDPTPEELKDPEFYGGKQSLLNFDADGNYL